MATLTPANRRRGDRVPPARTSWQAAAVLRPGQDVVVLNISRHGALVESAFRLRPGLRTEVQLTGAGNRRTVAGCLERCHVAGLRPLRYRAVVVFDASEELMPDEASGE